VPVRTGPLPRGPSTIWAPARLPLGSCWVTVIARNKQTSDGGFPGKISCVLLCDFQPNMNQVYCALQVRERERNGPSVLWLVT
jgi:hypothetical protein